MPELTPKQLSDLTPVAAIAGGTLFYLCPEDEYTDSGYDSNYITAMDLFSSAFSDLQFPLIFTKTTAKTPAGAINEVAPVIVTATLPGLTGNLVVSDPAFHTSSMVDIYTSEWGASPETVTLAEGSITMTFTPRLSSLSIKIKVW